MFQPTPWLLKGLFIRDMVVHDEIELIGLQETQIRHSSSPRFQWSKHRESSMYSLYAIHHQYISICGIFWSNLVNLNNKRLHKTINSSLTLESNIQSHSTICPTHREVSLKLPYIMKERMLIELLENVFNNECHASPKQCHHWGMPRIYSSL